MCKEALEKMGISSCSKSYKIEHEIIMFICNIPLLKIELKNHYSGNIMIMIEPVVLFVHLKAAFKIRIIKESKELFIDALIRACSELWDYLNEQQRLELKRILES